jgi:hypothetical protein
MMFYAMNTNIIKTTIGFGQQKRFSCAGAFTLKSPAKPFLSTWNEHEIRVNIHP